MKLSNEQIQQIVAHRGTCPICQSKNVAYFSADFDGEMLYYPCECGECGATFEETYNLEFVGHYNIKDDDNEIELIEGV